MSSDHEYTNQYDLRIMRMKTMDKGTANVHCNGAVRGCNTDVQCAGDNRIRVVSTIVDMQWL
jgi:hypothetical protein